MGGSGTGEDPKTAATPLTQKKINKIFKMITNYQIIEPVDLDAKVIEERVTQ